MNFYSQNNPAYADIHLGNSLLTIKQAGCFDCSIATLFQHDPVDLAQHHGDFDLSGDLFPAALAEVCGGTYNGVSYNPIHGWQIGMTDHYAHLGFPTHFFCVNEDTKQQIDPLKFPAVLEPLWYNVVEYRLFSGIKLDTTPTPPASGMADVPDGQWYTEAATLFTKLGITTAPNGLWHPEASLTKAQAAVMMLRLAREIQKGTKF